MPNLSEVKRIAKRALRGNNWKRSGQREGSFFMWQLMISQTLRTGRAEVNKRVRPSRGPWAVGKVGGMALLPSPRRSSLEMAALFHSLSLSLLSPESNIVERSCERSSLVGEAVNFALRNWEYHRLCV